MWSFCFLAFLSERADDKSRECFIRLIYNSLLWRDCLVLFWTQMAQAKRHQTRRVLVIWSCFRLFFGIVTNLRLLNNIIDVHLWPLRLIQSWLNLRLLIKTFLQVYYNISFNLKPRFFPCSIWFGLNFHKLINKFECFNFAAI